MKVLAGVTNQARPRALDAGRVGDLRRERTAGGVFDLESNRAVDLVGADLADFGHRRAGFVLDQRLRLRGGHRNARVVADGFLDHGGLGVGNDDLEVVGRRLVARQEDHRHAVPAGQRRARLDLAGLLAVQGHLLDAERTVAVRHHRRRAVGARVLAQEGHPRPAALQQHGSAERAVDQPGARFDGEHRQRLAAVVTVPDHHFGCAAGKETADGRVDFAGDQALMLGAGGFGQRLPADPRDALGVGDDEDRLARLRARRDRQERKEK